MTKIEKKVPIKKPRLYVDLVAMEKGDSFTFPESQYTNLRNIISMQVKKRYPSRRFTTRRVSATRRRVWRL